MSGFRITALWVWCFWFWGYGGAGFRVWVIRSALLRAGSFRNPLDHAEKLQAWCVRGSLFLYAKPFK